MTLRTVGLSCLSFLAALPAIAAVHTGLLTQDVADPDQFSRRMRGVDEPLKTSARQAEVEGWNLYRYDSLQDIAAYVISEGLSPEQRESIDGSIVVSGADWRVRFFNVEDGQPTPVGDVVFSPQMKPVLQQRGLEAFNDKQLSMIKAQETVRSSAEAPCEGYYTFVTLPANDGWTVYQVRLVDEEYRIPQGLHLRHKVSQDGSTVNGHDRFGRRCSVLGHDPAPGEALETLNMTESSESVPTPVQVYLSLRYGQTLYIATLPSNLFWTVTDGMIQSDR